MRLGMDLLPPIADNEHPKQNNKGSPPLTREYLAKTEPLLFKKDVVDLITI